MSLIAAFGLLVAGLLFRIAMKIAGARRRTINLDQSDSNWVPDPNEHELRDGQQSGEAVNQWQALVDALIDRPDSGEVQNEQGLRDGGQRSEADHQPDSAQVQNQQGLRHGGRRSGVDHRHDLVQIQNKRGLRNGGRLSGVDHQEAELIEDLQTSLIPSASDYTSRHLLRNDDELQQTRKRGDREPEVADAVRKREDTLEQLRRDLDRLLRSPKVA